MFIPLSPCERTLFAVTVEVFRNWVTSQFFEKSEAPEVGQAASVVSIRNSFPATAQRICDPALFEGADL